MFFTQKGPQFSAGDRVVLRKGAEVWYFHDLNGKFIPGGIFLQDTSHEWEVQAKPEAIYHPTKAQNVRSVVEVTRGGVRGYVRAVDCMLTWAGPVVWGSKTLAYWAWEGEYSWALYPPGQRAVQHRLIEIGFSDTGAYLDGDGEWRTLVPGEQDTFGDVLNKCLSRVASHYRDARLPATHSKTFGEAVFASRYKSLF